MPDNRDPPHIPCTGIRFANGQQWRLRPTDTASDVVIRRMSGIMQLTPALSGPEMFVTVREMTWKERNHLPGQDPIICILPAGNDEIIQVVQMTDLATAIAFETLPAGGLLIHGALAERNGLGMIFAAPGGTGKTTASKRIPPPWHSLSDDATLVVPGPNGQYIAHPWPTWSRFHRGGIGSGTWEVERGIPLAAIFFLSRSDDDRTEPMEIDEAAAFLMESVHQAMGSFTRVGFTRKEAESIYRMEMAAVSGLARRVPAHLLHISLTGRFWDAIAPVLDRYEAAHPATRAEGGAHPVSPARPASPGTQKIAMFGAGHIPIVYSGPSMNPTLQVPDLLEVEPCAGRVPVVGDVICFYAPEKDKNIVHRVIGSSGTGLITRGDNNPTPDPEPVTADLIIGKVVTAWRKNEHRPIAGGWKGRCTHTWLRVRKAILIRTAWIIRLGKPFLVLTRALPNVFPGGYRPRVVLFTDRHTNTLRLFFGSSVAGEFSEYNGWRVRYPFRLLVNESTLPTVVRPPRHDRVREHPPGNPDQAG
jgi:SynChlorMet cassette protein ScmC